MSVRWCFFLGFLLLLSPLVLLRCQDQGRMKKESYKGTIVGHVEYSSPWRVAADQDKSFWAIGSVCLWIYQDGHISHSKCYYIPLCIDRGFEVGDAVEVVDFEEYRYARKLRKLTVKK